MTDIKNKDVLEEIKLLLKDKDDFQREIIVKTLQYALLEHTTGKKLKIDDKLYEWIDAEARNLIRDES